MSMIIDIYLRRLSRVESDMFHVQKRLSNCQTAIARSWNGRDGQFVQEALKRLKRQGGIVRDELSELRESLLEAQAEIEEEEAAAEEP